MQPRELRNFRNLFIGACLAWLAGLALLLSSVARAGEPLPSAISGAYLTPERACRVELYRYVAPQWTNVQADCLRWYDGLATSVLATIFTPNGQCPQDFALPFDPRGLGAVANKAGAATLPGVYVAYGGAWLAVPDSFTTEYFGIRTYTSTTLSVGIGGDPSGILNGGGISQAWNRVDTIASRSPYACTPAPALRFRVFGR